MPDFGKVALSELGSISEHVPSSNLLDWSQSVAGNQLATAGYIFPNVEYTASPLINVDGLDYVIVSIENILYPGVSNRAMFLSDEDSIIGSVLSVYQGVDYVGNNIFAVPEGAKYFRFQISTAHIQESSTFMLQSGQEYTGYMPHGDTVEWLLPEIIDARGGYNSLKDRLNDIAPPNNIVDYWGDSLTQGSQDGSGVGRPTIMQTLLGVDWTINNWGVGGEQSNTIACRQGGMNFIIKSGLVIPSGTTAVDTTGYLFDMRGDAVGLGNGIYSSAYNGWDSVNPCYISGIKGNLTKADISSPVMFTRLAIGVETTITRPATVITNSMLNFKKRVMVIFMGQNMGFDTADPQELVEQIKYMIDFNGYDKYLVIGLCHSTNPTYSWQVAVNTALKREFGRHFIDIEEYTKTPIYDVDEVTVISSYAMDDTGLTPTAQDLIDIGNQAYPTSIMFDGIHFNQYGYTVIANLEYKRGQELGYW